MTRPALLDVNVLVALFDPDHIHHDLAHDWFADNRSQGWATCPLTENGFVRVLANPAYGGPVARASELLSRLGMFCRAEDHQFWPDVVSLRDETRFDPAMMTGHLPAWSRMRAAWLFGDLRPQYSAERGHPSHAADAHGHRTGRLSPVVCGPRFAASDRRDGCVVSLHRARDRLTSDATWPRIGVMFRARCGGPGLGLGGPEAGRDGTRHPW